MSSTKQEFDHSHSAAKSGKRATCLTDEQKDGKADSTRATTSTRSPERKAQPEASATKKEEEPSPKEPRDQKTDSIAMKKTTDGARRSKRLSQQQPVPKEVDDEIGEAEDEAWDQPVYKAPSRRGKR